MKQCRRYYPTPIIITLFLYHFFSTSERQHKEALENLKKKQEEVEIVATKKQTEMIDKLKQRISELEAEKEVQNERHQELILEMAELKKYGPESIASDIEAPSDNLEIGTVIPKLLIILNTC